MQAIVIGIIINQINGPISQYSVRRIRPLKEKMFLNIRFNFGYTEFMHNLFQQYGKTVKLLMKRKESSMKQKICPFLSALCYKKLFNFEY